MDLACEDQSKTIRLQLQDEEKDHIREVFFRDVAPKLARLNARKGTISCEFAGIQYGRWTIQFDSRRSGFEILNIEYDEEAGSLDLDP